MCLFNKCTLATCRIKSFIMVEFYKLVNPNIDEKWTLLKFICFHKLNQTINFVQLLVVSLSN